MNMADKKNQVLELIPPTELVFKGPFTDVVTSTLKLRNPMNDTVIFKVKTTAPKQYCVRPNSGVIAPHEESDIAVMLQPFDPAATDKNKHKFMVQTMFAPTDFSPDQLDTIWKNAPKTQLMDSRLRCVFLDEAQSTTPPQEQLEAIPESEAPTASPGESEAAFKSVMSSPQQVTEEAQEEQEDLIEPEPVKPVQQPTAGSTPGPTPPASKADREKEQIEANMRMLQDKVDKLSSENNQLKSDTNKLRQRLTSQQAGVATAPLKAGSPSSRHSTPSLNLVAVLLILVALFLGYLVGRWL